MGAFILAGLVFVVTLVVCVIGLMAAGMSDSPSGSDAVAADVLWWFIGGTCIAVLISATHFMSHIGW